MNRFRVKSVALVVLLVYSSVVTPVAAQSLKNIPSNEELFEILTNPIPNVTGGPRPPRSFPNVPGFFPHSEAPLDLNQLTFEPLVVDPVTGAICFGTLLNTPLQDPCFPGGPGVPSISLTTGLAYDPGPLPPGTGAYTRLLQLPPNETDFFIPGTGRAAAVRLGKALFWDMQVGSDSVQACASCHFHAGADNRVTNQLNPGTPGPLGNLTPFQTKGPNQTVTASDFPTHKLANPLLPSEPLLNPGNVVSDTRNIMSSMGVTFGQFMDIKPIGAPSFIPLTNPPALRQDIGCPSASPLCVPPFAAVVDPVPVFQGVRRVEGRNTPSLFASAANFNNFWDGRARQDFNGGSVFGASDAQRHIFVDSASPLLPPAECDALAVGGLVSCRTLIRLSSIASLSTGPVLSNFEMSFNGRNWGKVGKKLLQGTLAPSATSVTPLANQLVHIGDSVLGPLSNQNAVPGRPGLSTTYQAMIQAAFKPEFWSNVSGPGHLNIVPAPPCPLPGCDPFDGVTLARATLAADPANRTQLTQMEANFSLFFGLAVQAFTQTLIPNNSAFDRFHDANPNEFAGVVCNTNNPLPVPPSLACFQTNGAAQLAAAGTLKGLPFLVSVVGLSPRQLYGYDLFQGSNLSMRNPGITTAKCNLCHIGPALTAHSIDFVQGTMGGAFDIVPPFTALGGPVVLTGVFLEDTLTANAPVAIELDNVNASLNALAFPSGSAILDEGIYNIGVRPTTDDLGRGINDPFGFPLSFAALALLNEGCTVGGAVPCSPAFVQTNPFTSLELLPPYLAPFVPPFPLGVAFPNINVSTFLPDTVTPLPELAVLPPSGTFPNANRVLRRGAFKVSQLKNLALTGPYFHNGGMITIRQVIDFYARGGDFPVTNAAHRDVIMVNFNSFPVGETLTEEDKDALVDFLISFTDRRVMFEQAPFDHPEIIVPIAGTAPANTGGRAALLADPRFLRVPEVGFAGRLTPLPNFLGVSNVRNSPGLDHFDK